MLGAIAGDIIGSIYEGRPIKIKDFPLFDKASRFTDDTVLTIAVADCLLNRKDYTLAFEDYFFRYPNAGYGMEFFKWALTRHRKAYHSWGNGSAMRATPVGWAFPTLEQTLEESKKSAEVTHNHPEGIKGAQATAAAVFLARTGNSRHDIKTWIEKTFGYDLNRTLARIRSVYRFDASCQGTVPEAIIAFLESTDFEDAVRNAISLGGDSDTLACITGGIAEAFYKNIPSSIQDRTIGLLSPQLVTVLQQFRSKYQA